MEICQTNKKAYTQFLEIIKYLPDEEYKKISKEKIEFYENNKDSLYRFEYNPLKSLNEQGVLRETKALLIILFNEVVATDEQKEKLNRILINNEQKYQNKLSEKYSYDKLFNKKQKNSKKENNTEMIVYKENIFLKLYNFLKKKFNRKT